MTNTAAAKAAIQSSEKSPKASTNKNTPRLKLGYSTDITESLAEVDEEEK